MTFHDVLDHFPIVTFHDSRNSESNNHIYKIRTKGTYDKTYWDSIGHDSQCFLLNFIFDLFN